MLAKTPKYVLSTINSIMEILRNNIDIEQNRNNFLN